MTDMIHSFKYTVLRLLRNKSNIFWILLFPMILGSLFKVAFSNLGASEDFEPIPVAIVIDGKTESPIEEGFRTIVDGLGEEGDGQMLKNTYCTQDEAMELLEAKDIDGILSFDGELRVTISANMSSKQVNQSILSSFADQYNIDSTIFREAALNNPQEIPAMVSQMTENFTRREEVTYAYHDSDFYVQYFYNLIAMACLYTAMGGIAIALDNQGNLSAIAARKTVSAAHKSAVAVIELFTYTLIEFLLNLLGFLFIIFILRVDMTMRIGYTVLGIFVGTLAGISMGFFLGSLGKSSEEAKVGLMFIIVMPCCFLSGLMMGNMRMIVEEHAPWLNHINPAALISDCFYSLTAYESLSRYFQNIGILCLFSILFSAGGILLTRRNRYASL